MEAKMEATAEKLESMFEKADADLDQLSRKLDAEFANETDEASGEINKGELLSKISDIRKEYGEVVQEAQAIQEAQKEAMEFFKGEIMTLCSALTQLQFNVGTDGEPSSDELQRVSELLDVPVPDEADLQSSSNAAIGESPVESTAVSSSSKSPPSTSKTEKSPVQDVHEVNAFQKRDGVSEFIEITDSEFESVSSLVRGRVKLSDVNHTYRILWHHFKEEGNSDPLTQAELYKMGLRVTGYTGEAKLKVLRTLKLLTISKKGDVMLV